MPENDKQNTAEPWRAIMADVAKMMEAALKEADHIVTEYRRSQKDTKEEGTVAPCGISAGTGKTIEMAVAIFEATATAEGGRRMVEVQKGNTLVGGKLVRVGKDGRPVMM